MVCVMFPQSDIQHQHTFVTRPFVNYKKALGKDSYLGNHERSEHHKYATDEFNRVQTSLNNPTTSLPYKISQQNRAIYDKT